MTFRPRIFTFYSYKGGVGRSMALLNVAYTLHSLGRHVLVVDMDLEAPGVSGFLRRNSEFADNTTPEQPDIIDLLRELKPEWGEESEESFHPSLKDYLRSVRTDGTKYAPPVNVRFRPTRLDVLCASDERDYASRLSELDIGSFDTEEIVEAGNTLREMFLSYEFPWQSEDGKEETSTQYDYILIDSRTGFSETGGLCIGPLSDRLVIFCGLNDQNINGTKEFLQVVGLSPRSDEAKWDEDVPEDPDQSPGLGEKPALLVASPVPFGEMEMKAQRFEEMERILGTPPDCQISYHPRLSIFETIFCRDGAAESINLEYRNITERMLLMVGDHPTQLERTVTDLDSKMPLDDELLRRLAASTEEDNLVRVARPLAIAAYHFGDSAKQKTGDEADALFQSSFAKYEEALKFKPDYHDALNSWGNALSNLAKRKEGDEADALFQSSFDKYEEALKIKPDYHDALYNWGNALFKLAEKKKDDEADALFQSSIEKYEEALKIKPDDHVTIINWGHALSSLAKRKEGDEADALFQSSFDKYEEALKIKPDDHDALVNWGNAFSSLAQQKEGDEADALFQSSIEKYEEALKAQPESHIALNGWGVALTNLARQKEGDEADALFQSSFEKYEEALRVQPDYHLALYNWGNAFSSLAQQKEGDEADTLFQFSVEKYEEALKAQPDYPSALFNLACSHALLADLKSSLKYLNRIVTLGLPLSKKKLDEDTDFDSIRNLSEFISFREGLKE